MKNLDQYQFPFIENNETLLIDKNFSFEDFYQVSPDIPKWVCIKKIKLDLTFNLQQCQALGLVFCP